MNKPKFLLKIFEFYDNFTVGIQFKKRNYLQTLGRSATFKKKTYANKLIKNCDKKILSIIFRVKFAILFCIFFDETTYVSQHNFDNKVHFSK